MYFLQRYLPEAHIIIEMDRIETSGVVKSVFGVSPKDKQEEARVLHEGSGDLLLNFPNWRWELLGVPSLPLSPSFIILLVHCTAEHHTE